MQYEKKLYIIDSLKQARQIIRHVKAFISQAVLAVRNEEIEHAEVLAERAISHLEELARLLDELEREAKGGGPHDK
ncbi:MAG: hypothetical protein J7L82_04690 [Staphylothermus sp.]|nr:hypothetical protein [Staphylothermus sp.]